jgi:hypothetical protein
MCCCCDTTCNDLRWFQSIEVLAKFGRRGTREAESGAESLVGVGVAFSDVMLFYVT